MSVVVIATVYPLPEHRAEVVAAYQAIIDQVHGEEGCLLYALHEGEDRLVLIEKWASAQALEAHSRTAVLASLHRSLEGRLRDRSDVQVLRPHPAGSADQGAL